MAAPMSVPPWLNLNPLEGVPLYLQGFGQGERAGASIREGEQQAAEFGQQQALAQQKETSVESELERERKEKAAKAARQFAGMTKYQEAIAAGKPAHEALIAAAPDMFYENPAAFATALNREELQSVNRARQAETAAHHLATEQARLTQLADAATNAAERRTLEQQKNDITKAWHDQTVENQKFRNELQGIRDFNGLYFKYIQGGDTPAEARQHAIEEADLSGLPVPKDKSKAEPAQTIALPSKKTDLKVGQVYQTAKGPRRWDGEKLREIVEATPAPGD